MNVVLDAGRMGSLDIGVGKKGSSVLEPGLWAGTPPPILTQGPEMICI